MANEDKLEALYNALNRLHDSIVSAFVQVETDRQNSLTRVHQEFSELLLRTKDHAVDPKSAPFDEEETSLPLQEVDQIHR